MKIKISVSKIRGASLMWFRKRYHALWFEWANGAQVLPNSKMKVLWIFPRIKYVHT